MIKKDYLNHEEGKGYSTHIVPLKFIFKHIEVKNAIEMGTGFYSTSFLLHHVKEKLISIEMQDRAWMKKVKARYKRPDIEWTLLYSDYPLIIMDLITRKTDFVLIDGSSISRTISAYLCMKESVPNIVLHDTESSWYGYEPLKEYEEHFGYRSFNFTKRIPNTRIYTKDKKLIDAIFC